MTDPIDELHDALSDALSDAKAAFKSLVHSTHLYGRRLVVEFASGDSSLEEMRSKTRKQWESGER